MPESYDTPPHLKRVVKRKAENGFRPVGRDTRELIYKSVADITSQSHVIPHDIKKQNTLDIPENTAEGIRKCAGRILVASGNAKSSPSLLKEFAKLARRGIDIEKITQDYLDGLETKDKPKK